MIQPFFNPVVEINSYFEINKDVQKTEDFCMESDESLLIDETEKETITLEVVDLREALNAINIISKFYGFKMPSEKIKASVFTLQDDLEKKNI